MNTQDALKRVQKWTLKVYADLECLFVNSCLPYFYQFTQNEEKKEFFRKVLDPTHPLKGNLVTLQEFHKKIPLKRFKMALVNKNRK